MRSAMLHLGTGASVSEAAYVTGGLREWRACLGGEGRVSSPAPSCPALPPGAHRIRMNKLRLPITTHGNVTIKVDMHNAQRNGNVVKSLLPLTPLVLRMQRPK